MDPSWKLDGFDISDLQFPVKEYLPENVSLGTLDIFDDIPEDLINKFDIVHIRAFALIIKFGNPGPLLKNLLKLLKPGGYLQWDEWDCETTKAHAPNPSVVKTATDDIFARWSLIAKQPPINLDFKYLSHLPHHLQAAGFSVVDSFRRSVRNDDRKAWTDDWMMALEESGSNLLARFGSGTPLGTAREFQERLDAAVWETQRGVSVEIDMVVAVGRKEG